MKRREFFGRIVGAVAVVAASPVVVESITSTDGQLPDTGFVDYFAADQTSVWRGRLYVPAQTGTYTVEGLGFQPRSVILYPNAYQSRLESLHADGFTITTDLATTT